MANLHLTVREGLADIPDGQHRIESLITLFRTTDVLDMPVATVEELAEAAMDKLEIVHWVKAILAAAQPPARRAALLQAVRDLPDAAGMWKVEALVFLAPIIEQEQDVIWNEASTLAKSAPMETDQRGRLLAGIVARMPAQLREGLLQEVCEYVAAMPTPYHRVLAWLDLRRVLRPAAAGAALDQASADLDRIQEPILRFQAAMLLLTRGELTDIVPPLTMALDAIAAAYEPRRQQTMLRMLRPKLQEEEGAAYDDLHLRWAMLWDAAAMALAFLGNGDEEE